MDQVIEIRGYAVMDCIDSYTSVVIEADRSIIDSLRHSALPA